MIVGMSTYVYETLELVTALSKIKHSGYRFVEIFANGGHLDPRYDSEIAVDQAARKLKELSLIVNSLHLPAHGIDIASLSEKERNISINVIKKALIYCSILHVHLAIVHPGCIWDADKRTFRRRILILVASIKEIVKMAKTLRIRIAVENVPHRITYPQPRFGSSVSHLLSLIQEIGDNHLGICLDTGHCVLNKLDPAKEAELAKNYLFSIHVNDNISDGRSDLHLVPTTGDIDWESFIRKLRSINYEGSFILEPAGGNSPDDTMRQCLNILNKSPFSLLQQKAPDE